MYKRSISSIIGCAMLFTAGCTTAQTAAITAQAKQVVSDGAEVYTDLQTAEAQIANSGTVSAASLSDIQNSITLVNSDITALDKAPSASKITVVLNDVNTAVTKLAPYSSVIAALVGVVASPARRSAAPQAITSTVGNKTAVDVAKLRAHAA